MTLNPDDPLAPAQEYADGKKENTLSAHVTYLDNPFWSDVLELERLDMERTDPDLYAHTYLGVCRVASEACVFGGKYSIEAFEPDLTIKPPYDTRKDTLTALNRHYEAELIAKAELEQIWQGPFQGADWGFSVDPTVLVRCWVYRRVLYIEYEAYAVGVDTVRTPELFDQVPDARKYVTRADSSRPEMISHMRQNGYPKVTAVDKWKGSVEDGISFMRSYEKIIIHPRCVKTAAEFRLYSYKVVKLTGDILPDLQDRDNHAIDAIRYAMTPAIKYRRAARFTQLRI